MGEATGVVGVWPRQSDGLCFVYPATLAASSPPPAGLWSCADLWAASAGAGSVRHVWVGSPALRAHGAGPQPLHHRAVRIQRGRFLLLH